MLKPVESIVQSLHQLFSRRKNAISYQEMREAASSLVDSLEREIEDIEKQLHQRRIKLRGVRSVEYFLRQCTHRNEEWELSQRYLSEAVVWRCFQISNKTQEEMREAEWL